MAAFENWWKSQANPSVKLKKVRASESDSSKTRTLPWRWSSTSAPKASPKASHKKTRWSLVFACWIQNPTLVKARLSWIFFMIDSAQSLSSSPSFPSKFHAAAKSAAWNHDWRDAWSKRGMWKNPQNPCLFILAIWKRAPFTQHLHDAEKFTLPKAKSTCRPFLAFLFGHVLPAPPSLSKVPEFWNEECSGILDIALARSKTNTYLFYWTCFCIKAFTSNASTPMRALSMFDVCFSKMPSRTAAILGQCATCMITIYTYCTTHATWTYTKVS